MTAPPPQSVGFAVMTVSDTRDAGTDRTGPYLREQITAAGHTVVDHAIVTDDIEAIRMQARTWIASDAIQAIIATGGTGLTGRDVTPEALESLYEKRMDGFSAVFHQVSYQSVGVSTIQSRASAGIANGTYIFAIPGSMGGCKDAWTHVLGPEFDASHKPCNLVELIPRLKES